MATDPLDEVVDGPITMRSALAQIDPYGVTRVDCWPIDLMIMGKPAKKDRPRFNRHTGHAYTTEATARGEDTIRQVWETLGQPRIDGDGALEMDVEAVFERPAGHFNRKGELNAEGLRWPHPTGSRVPDGDNLLKAVADSLNGCAYIDDRLLVRNVVTKRWARPPSGADHREHAHTHIRIRPYQED